MKSFILAAVVAFALVLGGCAASGGMAGTQADTYPLGSIGSTE
jgi:hypothetical protein